ncbi:hypothetical protein LTR62_007918 [Meristemomyces frigidus]|uniref:A-kinase anchor protein 7-like phosphoesterase domain-containing protein n=1 Tax=Meristemomyces frigidus TaxID=1508187 RepID=A0AAN7TH96_9PEZI|nr:hypothetical protein LTR62_007918 [Meristemomyces frigidus]
MTRSGGSKSSPASTPKKPLTHFLCLPLVTARSRTQFETSMRTFRNEVTTEDGAAVKSGTRLANIHPKAVRPIGALHCTLGVMSLTRQELEQAVQLLQTLDIDRLLRLPQVESKQGRNPSSDEVLSSPHRPVSPPQLGRATPLTVDLKGLVSMHDPRNTSILYTPPHDSTDRLYPFCLAVQKLFKDAGFLVEDNRELKLHATIVNTIYAKGRSKRPPKRVTRQETADPSRMTAAVDDRTSALAAGQADERSQGHGPNANAPLKIDATAIVEHYADFVWVKDVVLDRIAICEMGAKKITDAEFRIIDEQYKEIASAKLPT